ISGCTMTLTLDDVRNKRFRAARKSGYEVLEVDEFVDEVRERFTLLLEYNHNLKEQVEALKSAPPVPAQTPAPLAQAPTVQPPVPQQPNPVRPSASGTIVVTTGKEASAAVVRLVEMSTEQAERLVSSDSTSVTVAVKTSVTPCWLLGGAALSVGAPLLPTQGSLRRSLVDGLRRESPQ